MTHYNHSNALPADFQVGQYIIHSILGHGGFGITYLAQDRESRAWIALKEYFPNELAYRRSSDLAIYPKTPEDADMFAWGLERFSQEAKALGQFQHTNIVQTLHNFHVPELNTAYIVMKYEEGRSLAQALEAGETADEEELLHILPPLLSGLSAVHEAGFLHRDIKPGNIYLRDRDNSPVLLDFGAARYALGTRSQSVTSIVSPGYAAFELYSTKGNRQGPWTDIYGLGAVLYRCIGGELLQDAPDRVSALVNKQADPLISAVEIGQGRYRQSFLEGIDWALAVMSNERPQSVDAWAEILLGSHEAKMPNTVYIVGRSGKADIQLSHAGSSMSGLHLALHVKGQRYFIEDNNSTNGTYLFQDGRWKKITEETEISSDTALMLGDVQLTVREILAHKPEHEIPQNWQPSKELAQDFSFDKQVVTDDILPQTHDYAGFGIRLWAFIIDNILMALITLPVLVGIYGPEYFESQGMQGVWDVILSWVFPAIVIITFWAYKSATPGKMAVRVKIIDAETGQKPSTAQFIGRYFAYILSALPLLIGFIWVAFDKKKQGWHDKLAGTLVVKY